METLDDATFLNVSIADAKHFPEALSVDDLFSELTTFDGCPLFECAGLLKSTGIDLMECPLQLSLKLHVRRRLQEGAALLWHMVLPLAVISKNLMQPPHEWDTWLGLLPSNQSLETYAPEMMFTQAVIHLLAKPEYPKLRLQFKYHNPELRVKMALQKQTEEERRQQQFLQAASYGQQRFQDLQSLGGLLDKRSAEKSGKAPTKAEDAHDAHGAEGLPEDFADQLGQVGQVPLDASLPVNVDARCADSTEAELKLSEAFGACLELLSELQAALGVAHDPLCVSRFSSCDAPAQLVRDHFQGLLERVTLDQRSLADTLQYALVGALDDVSSMGPPASPASPASSASGLAQPMSQMLAVRERLPVVWQICQQVSQLANDKARLMEEIEASAYVPNPVLENARLRTELVEAKERARKAEEELAQTQARLNDLTLALSRGQSPEIDLL